MKAIFVDLDVSGHIQARLQPPAQDFDIVQDGWIPTIASLDCLYRSFRESIGSMAISCHRHRQSIKSELLKCDQRMHLAASYHMTSIT